MLDKLNAKKAALVAARDQAIANLNALVGAIQCCDDLIADAVADSIVAKAAEQIEVTSINDAEPRFVPAGPEMKPVIRDAGCNRVECEFPKCDCDPDLQ
jgi:hypothetical protein